jgi:TM2 domain-containing membrane protein YozV
LLIVISNEEIMMKSPALAAILSLLIPGLGQMYAGRIGKGIGILLFMGILAIVSFILSFVVVGIFGWIVYFIVWVWNIFDAYSLASRAGAPTQATKA